VTPARASRTALRVALHRAAHQLLDPPPVFVDRLALKILPAPVEAELLTAPNQYDTSRFAPQMRGFMAVRARFAEEQIAAARTAGIGQIVILGAGLDTYAYRAATTPPVTIFEVDHPATQDWKRELLDAASIAPPSHLTFVGADLAQQPLEGALAEAGFDARHGAVFSWLGVTQYLTPEQVFRTLDYVARVTARGGGIAFDYALAPKLLRPEERAAYDALAARVRAVGEPWLSHFVPLKLAAALKERGFPVAIDLDPQQLLERYAADAAARPRLGRLARLMWAGAAAYTA
jgi:methyltransferase (TIGR00027 family)